MNMTEIGIAQALAYAWSYNDHHDDYVDSSMFAQFHSENGDRTIQENFKRFQGKEVRV